MKNYEKPVVMVNEGLAEGVYAASGCFLATATMVQAAETGNLNYTYQVDGQHNATHHSTSQTVTFEFAYPVEYVSGGQYVSGDGTKKITIDFSQHFELEQTAGLGNLVVKPVDSANSLGNVGDKISGWVICNEICSQHDHLGNY